MSLRRDFSYALRGLRRSPAFTLTALASLAVGLAANAAIFSLADTLLLREPPAIAEPDRLVDVGRSQDGAGFDNLSYPNYLDFRERNTVFTGLAAHRPFPAPMGLGIGDDAERVFGSAVSANYFDVLGVRMMSGRGFGAEEDRIGGASDVAVLSHGLWQRRFDAAPNVVGRTLRVNGRPFTVVGIAPRAFAGPSVMAPDVWIPLTAHPRSIAASDRMLTDRAAVWLMCVGRLKPGVTLEQARANMAAIAADLERAYPRENLGKGSTVAASGSVPAPMRSAVAGFVALLFALVGLVLLIACANVAGMLLARGVGRGREIAVRLAIGASRARIVRQLVTESIVLALGGGLAGVLGAVVMVRVLRAFLPALPFPVALDLHIDPRVLAFSLALAVISGIAFGLVPALHLTSTDLVTRLRSDRMAGGSGRTRLRHGFVAAQVGLSVLLVVCALVLARSLHNAARIDVGFEAARVDVFEIDSRLAGYDDVRARAFADRLLEGVAAVPGVRSAALARVVPLTGSGLGLGRVRVAGEQATDAERVQPEWNVVTPAFFETLRMSVVRGRAFTDADGAGAPRVAIVNETFARKAWPGQEPLGQVLWHDTEEDEPARELRVAGVVRNGKYRSIGEAPRAFLWVPLAQHPGTYTTRLSLLVRRHRASVIGPVRDVIRRLDASLPVVSAATLVDVTALGLVPHRAAAWIAGSFGLVGLLLACIGIYGIAAYSVSQRIREIGVRVALGASPRDLMRLVLSQSLRLACIGGAAGLVAAAGATRLLVSLLYGIRPLDPASFGGAAALFASLTLLASWFPARRAARVDPVEALRAE